MLTKARIIVFSIIIAVIAMTASLQTASAEYFGSRWKHQSICVQNQVSHQKIRLAVYDAVHDMNDNTDLKVRNYGSTSCEDSGYSQIIYVRDHNYGDTGWTGKVDFNGWTWGETNGGKWTWFNNSGVVIRLNHHYYNTRGGWQHIAIHELAHSVGVGHNTESCNSVVTQVSGCSWLKTLTTKDIIGNSKQPGVNTIYSW